MREEHSKRNEQNKQAADNAHSDVGDAVHLAKEVRLRHGENDVQVQPNIGVVEVTHVHVHGLAVDVCTKEVGKLQARQAALSPQLGQGSPHGRVGDLAQQLRGEALGGGQ